MARYDLRGKYLETQRAQRNPVTLATVETARRIETVSGVAEPAEITETPPRGVSTCMVPRYFFAQRANNWSSSSIERSISSRVIVKDGASVKTFL